MGFIFLRRVVHCFLTNSFDFAMSNKTRTWQKAAWPDSETNYSDVVSEDTVYKAFGESGHAQPITRTQTIRRMYEK